MTSQDFDHQQYNSVGIDYLQGTPKVRPTSFRYLQLFAGQPDPRDASQFTTTGTLGDAKIEMKGQLNDKDNVELTPLTGNYWPSTGHSG